MGGVDLQAHPACMGDVVCVCACVRVCVGRRHCVCVHAYFNISIATSRESRGEVVECKEHTRESNRHQCQCQ